MTRNGFLIIFFSSSIFPNNLRYFCHTNGPVGEVAMEVKYRELKAKKKYKHAEQGIFMAHRIPIEALDEHCSP